MIAAHAFLVTDNVKHLARLTPLLQVEYWVDMA